MLRSRETQTRQRRSRRTGQGGGIPLALLVLFALLVPAAPGAAQDIEDAISECLMCHADDSLEMELNDGSTMNLHVDQDTYLASVHGNELVCTDCHEGYEQDHPSGTTYDSETAYKLISYELCRKCHFDTYTRTLESVHYELLKNAPEVAPVCTDCHGAHDIADPHRKQATMSHSCAQCHADVYDTYAASVHGKALVENGIEAVPGCADCHTAHSIRDATTAAFHMGSPDICIDCHGNAELMRDFGISTTVASTYLADFHGVTATLAQPSEVEERHLVVTCVDCHGVHDIASPAALPEGALKAQVQETCNRCHEGAAQDFPAAWLSHYPPSLDHAPLVFLIDLFYKVFIPFMIVGLLLHVTLHLYRVAAHR